MLPGAAECRDTTRGAAASRTAPARARCGSSAARTRSLSAAPDDVGVGEFNLSELLRAEGQRGGRVAAFTQGPPATRSDRRVPPGRQPAVKLLRRRPTLAHDQPLEWARPSAPQPAATTRSAKTRASRLQAPLPAAQGHRDVGCAARPCRRRPPARSPAEPSRPPPEAPRPRPPALPAPQARTRQDRRRGAARAAPGRQPQKLYAARLPPPRPARAPPRAPPARGRLHQQHRRAPPQPQRQQAHRRRQLERVKSGALKHWHRNRRSAPIRPLQEEEEEDAASGIIGDIDTARGAMEERGLDRRSRPPFSASKFTQ